MMYNWNNGDDEDTVNTWRGRPQRDHWDYISSSGGYIDGVGVNLQFPDPLSFVTAQVERGTIVEESNRCY
jgi:hypothetical protein